jgi:lysozyme
VHGLGEGRELRAFLRTLPDDEYAVIDRAWEPLARVEQYPPPGDWLTWLFLGGRGAGKTRAGAEFVRDLAKDATGPIALVGETYADVREVMIEGVSGILRVGHGGDRPVWIPSRRRVEWPSGVVAHAFSSEDPEALRGPQFAAAWSDGVGHTAAAGPPVPKAGMTITREEAFAILERDLPGYERRVETALGSVPQSAFDGGVSFDFNTGAIARASWVKAYRGGDRARARQGLLAWTRAGGRRVAGLVRRRDAEAQLIFEGDYGRIDAGADAGPAETATLQRQLATLGFYRGAVDGMAGPLTRAAILAYQKMHPDLVADGIAGPATRASLARDLAARAGAVAAAAGMAVAGVAGAVAVPGEAWIVGIAAAVLVLAMAGAVLAVRYRAEFRRLFTRRQGD